MPQYRQILVRKISDETELIQEDVKAVIERLLEIIIETLLKKGKIEICNFGVFELFHFTGRKSNLKPWWGSDKEFKIKARNIVKFFPSLKLERLIEKNTPKE